MNDEIVYKAQEKAALTRRPMSSTALTLIGGGAALLVANLLGFSLLEFFAPLLFIGGFGLLLMQPARKMQAGDHPSFWAWLAVPGAFFLTLGTLVFLLLIVDHPEAFAYAWTLFPASIAAGIMYIRRHDENHKIHETGYKLIRTMLFLFMGLGAFFELLVFETLGPWWPLLLVGTGIYLYMKEKNGEASYE